MSMATTLTDIHPDIIQTHILKRLDGPSLSATATASSYLNTLCSDHTLWSAISRSTWPSITNPHIDHIISTFSAGHRSFFHDSSRTLTTHCNRFWPSFESHHPSELISAVDIRYQNNLVYSTVKFTEIRPQFLSSKFCIELNEPGRVHEMSRSIIDLTVDELAGPDKETVSHVEESVTLSWIIIDPVRKRACNLSSVKPVSMRADWVTNETHIRYVTVLPGCDPNEMVQCRICLTLGVGERGVGLKVKEVTLRIQDVDSCCLNGMEFLRVIEGVIMEENNVTRKVVNDDERLKSYLEFKKMKRERKEWVKKKQRYREVAIDFSFVVVSLLYSALVLSLFYGLC